MSIEDDVLQERISNVKRNTSREIFMDLEEHNGGWDGLMINSYWVKQLKEKYGVSDIPTVEAKPFSPPVRW